MRQCNVAPEPEQYLNVVAGQTANTNGYMPHAKGYRRNNNQLAAGGRGEMAIGMETTTQRGHILPITNNYCAFRVRADVVFGLWAVNFILAARCLNVKLHQIIRVIDVTAD